MAFRFDSTQPVATGAREMLTRQLTKAVRLLRAGLEDEKALAPGIHGARKCFKRSRALLKLIRPGLKRSAARRLNSAIRDCGRNLGGARDRTAGLATLTWLAAQPRGLPVPVVDAVRKLYLAPAEPLAGTGFAADVGLPDVRDALVEALEGADTILSAQLAKLDLARLGSRHMARAFADSYRDGRARYAVLDILTADDEDVHDLRKPVQHHWRQSALLSEVWPEMMTLRLETARRVSKMLGIDHDLSLLAAHVEHGLHVRRLADDKALLLERCREVQQQLRVEADPWLKRLYGVPPETWEEAIPQWWDAARDELAQTATGESPLVPMRAIS